jgi:hypothetical protein
LPCAENGSWQQTIDWLPGLLCCTLLAWLQSYAVDSILSGADLTNAVVDRVDFSNAKLNGAKFVNAVVTGAHS